MLILSTLLFLVSIFLFFFFNDTATTEIYPLSLHDALPILPVPPDFSLAATPPSASTTAGRAVTYSVSAGAAGRSEEHTSELQSHLNLVCRLLLEKKKNYENMHTEMARTTV